MNRDQQCHGCGNMYSDAEMADWTICRGCKQREMEEYHGGPVFIDSLGIAWSEEELRGAGGQAEVERMALEADIRNKNLNEEN